MSEAKKLPAIDIVKFIIGSILGIIAFFVKLPLGGTIQIPINRICGLIKASCAKFIPYVVLIAGLYGLYDCIFVQKAYKKPVDILFTVFKILGIICILFCIFNFGPKLILAPDIGPSALSVLGMAVAVTVLVGSLLLPLLLDFGLANAIGVLLRPLMRPLFKLPGRTAVLSVTAYLANYSIGHIGINKMYTKGQITHKEAFIVGTGFATASIVNYMVFATMVDIMDNWGLFFLLVTVITIIATIIQVRLFPTTKIPEEYYKGAKPDPEPEYSSNILKNAFEEGVMTAKNADNIGKILLNQLKMGFIILAKIVPIAMFYIVVGVLLNTYTPIFTWIGYIFWPFFKIAGFSDLATVMPAAGMSIVDLMMIPSLGAKAMATTGLTMTSRFFLAGLPITEVVFLSGFVPSIMATEVPVKMSHLVVIWLIRVIISILLFGLFGFLFL